MEELTIKNYLPPTDRKSSQLSNRRLRRQTSTGSFADATETRYDWWILVCIVLCNTSSGIYVTGTRILYSDIKAHYDTTSVAVGWMYAINDFLSLAFGLVFTYPLNVYGSRIFSIVGTFVLTLGMLLTYFSPSIVFLYVSHGIIGGTGVSIIMLSVPVVLQHHFSKNRGFATGFAMLGWSVGNILAPILVDLVRDEYGWRGAILIVAALQVQNISLFMFFRFPEKKRKDDPSSKKLSGQFSLRTYCQDVVDFSILKYTPFLMFCITAFLQKFIHVGYFTHTFNMSLNIGLSRDEAVWAMSTVSITALAVRVVVTFLANIKAVVRSLIFTAGMFIFSVAMVTLLLLPPLTATFLSSALVGVFIGATTTIYSVVVFDYLGLIILPKGLAACNFCISFSVLIASPTAGWIFDILHSYTLPFAVFGFLSFVGGVVLSLEFIIRRHRQRRASVQLSLPQ